jgi:antitoxin YefM
MCHVSLTELRKRMASYLDLAVSNREPLIVTRPAGKGDVVILAADEYEALQETVHLLSSPANAARLLASVAQDRAGTTQERPLLSPEGSPDTVA